MYEEFSSVYDRLMSDVDYDLWSEYICSLLKENGVPFGAAVYECCCGTGELTKRLVKCGYKITASDLSEDMLMIAREKCRRAGTMIPFVKADMREITVHRPIDAVIACCDGVNYLTAEGDAEAFFKAAWTSLKPGGILLFDISSEYKLSKILGMNTFGEDEGDIAYIWKNMYDDTSKLVELDLTFFVREGTAYKKFKERQVQRAFAVEELETALAASGFDKIKAFGFGTDEAPGSESERIQFFARKKA